MRRTSRKQNQCLADLFRQVVYEATQSPKQVSLCFQSQQRQKSTGKYSIHLCFKGGKVGFLKKQLKILQRQIDQPGVRLPGTGMGVGPGSVSPAQSQTPRASALHYLGAGGNSSNYLAQLFHFQDGETDSERMRDLLTVPQPDRGINRWKLSLEFLPAHHALPPHLREKLTS